MSKNTALRLAGCRILVIPILLLAVLTILAFANDLSPGLPNIQDQKQKRQMSSAPNFKISPLPPSHFIVSPQVAALVVGAISVVFAGLMV
jgi:hypothetical protein